MLKQTKFDRLKRRILRRPLYLTKQEYAEGILDWLNGELKKEDIDEYLFEVSIDLKYIDKQSPYNEVPF